MYEIIPQSIPQARRAEINEKILADIESGENRIPRQTIYNCYTGVGGLHNLDPDQFANYHEYACAKREFEQGQFFTPHALCRQIVSLAASDPTETVLDMGCGMGNFFNFLPNLHNAYGFDIDPRAVKVAGYLYPEAHISVQDMQQYEPAMLFDLLLGNPPFNLKFGNDSSQFYYFRKAYSVLKPAGLLLCIVPCSFLQSEFWDKSQIRYIDNCFSFLGQTKLPQDTFEDLGVAEFATKLVVFSRESAHIESRPYREDEFITQEQLRERIARFREIKCSLKLKLRQETNRIELEEEQAFEYKMTKYLYEIKTHPHLRPKYEQAIALVSKFRSQTPPENASKTQYEEYQRSKLTYAKVLAILRRYVREQYFVPQRKVALVKNNYSYKLKAYAPHLLDDIAVREVPIYKLTIDNGGLPDAGAWLTPDIEKQYRAARRVIGRKHREYLRQSIPYFQMPQDSRLAEYIDGLSFVNKDGERCRFTDLQRHDMNWLFQKRFNLLNWQQGSGKTAVAYHFAKYIRSLKRVHNTIVVAPALAIEMTWEPFLTRQKKRYTRIMQPRHLENIRPGEFIVVSVSMLGKLKYWLKRFVKSHSHKLCLIFDESDELTNDTSQRTRNTLNLFRRCPYKILATGTTTRNNIAEQYSQLSLLYNNSVNMMCWCPKIYYEDRETHEIADAPNEFYGEPFPAYGGAALFKSCFCPGKVTVFGIEKHNQDIYNKEVLWELNAKTVLTRKFREFAGEKYEIKNHVVLPCAGEKAVYEKILTEFCQICNLFFNSTGDTRKDAAMKIVRQIILMIKACSIANTMPGYTGEPFPAKVRHIAAMVRNIPQKVAIGCTTLDALEMYEDYVSAIIPNRPLFLVHGRQSFKKRRRIIDRFDRTTDGILVCTQQALKSSVNIPSCDDIILESLQWNIPRMEQFYFRFIRLDSEQKKRVHFVTYDESIEQNLLALVTTKERLNEFIKLGEIREESEIFEEFDLTPSLIEKLLTRQRDDDGKLYVSWGNQRIVAA